MEFDHDIASERPSQKECEARREVMRQRMALCSVKTEPADGRGAFADIWLGGDSDLALQVAAAFRELDLVLSASGALSLVPRKR
jgi:hypothetical protein